MPLTNFLWMMLRKCLRGSYVALLAMATWSQATTVTITTSGNWTAPAGVTTVTVEAWGGGGAGGGATVNPSMGGGGAGGQYARKVLTVVPGLSYAVVVGAGGTGGTGNGPAGGDSTFAVTAVVAKGGAGGTAAVNGVAGAGSSSAGVGDVVYAGGSGSAGSSSGTGGAGGGGAGSTGAGGAASGSTAGAGSANGGGDGGNGLFFRGSGNAGSAAGGGGGGGYATNSTARSGGSGARGEVRISYAQTPSVTTNAASAILAGGATMNGAVTSNGGSTTVTFEYGLTTAYGSTVTAIGSPVAFDASGLAVSAAVTGLATNTTYHFRVKGVNGAGTANGADRTFTTLPPPTVSSINRASFDPTKSGQSVTWTVTFSTSVTGVDAADFALVPTGGVTGASIAGVSGSGTTWTVTANTGTNPTGSLGLNLVDNDSIASAGVPLGGAGSGNGNFSGQTYTLVASACTGAADIVFCDDFERSNSGGIGNGWTITPANASNCAGAAGNTGCAGIDSDIAPWTTYSNPRANPTRAMFTRWSTVSVDSPVISLAGKSGAQLSFWMRRGRDTFSECPEASGENYLVQYYASNGTWKILAQYPSSPSAALCDGQIFTPTIELPADAMHSGFKLRFYQPSGSGDSGSGGATGVVGYDYWHMDDVVVRETTAPSFTGAFCDNFEAGLGRWSVSAENFSSGNIGDASVGTTTYQSSSHALNMRWGYVTASTFKTNLTGVTGDITYWVRSGTTTAMDPVTNENLVAEYLNSSGTWTTLATYLGSAAAGTTYTPSFTIPADAKHANFRLRFRQVAGSGYDKSYWHIDDVCVGDLLPTADLALSKTGDSTLVPGTNTTYTLRATNNGPAAMAGSMQIVDTLPNGLSYVSATGTGWSCSANAQVVTCNWTGTLANGATAADLQILAAVGAGVTGSVTNTAVLTGSTNDSNTANNTASFTSGNFTPFFVFTDAPCVDGIAIGQASQPCHLLIWSPQMAGQAKTGVYITSVNTSGIPTKLSSSSATVVGVQFGLTCHDPTVDAGVQATFSASATALPLCTGNGAEPTSWTNSSNLTFPVGAPSVATAYTFAYADVGEVELYMRNGSATSQKGTSGQFVVKPAGFVLSTIRCTTADAVNCGAGALAMPTAGNNPGAANASGVTFIRAGHSFSMTVTALTASGKTKADAGTAINCSTVPADCTPNFGKEVTPESVGFDVTNVVAGMVTPPDIAGSFGAFTGGVASGIAFSWDEAGIITLTPNIKDSDYLGAGDVAGTTTGNIGRFYPHHFDTTVTQGCSDAFTYSGQPLSLRIVAYKAGGSGASGITSNYGAGAGFSKITTASGFGATGAITGGDASANQFSAAKFTLGATPLLNAAAVLKPTFAFTTTPSSPVSVKMRAVDQDGVSSADGAEATTEVRSGRVNILNAYGSELLDLPMAARAEYWRDATQGWGINTADTCTDLTLAFTQVGATNITAKTCVLETGNNSGKGCAAVLAPSQTGRGYLETGVAGFAGNFNLWLKAPGTGFPGSINVTATVPAWLQFPWTSATASNPVGRATFGVYKSPLIYRRENY